MPKSCGNSWPKLLQWWWWILNPQHHKRTPLPIFSRLFIIALYELLTYQRWSLSPSYILLNLFQVCHLLSILFILKFVIQIFLIFISSIYYDIYVPGLGIILKKTSLHNPKVSFTFYFNSLIIVYLHWKFLSILVYGVRYAHEMILVFFLQTVTCPNTINWMISALIKVTSMMKLFTNSLLPNFFFFCLFRSAPSAYGSSQTRGQIGVVAASHNTTRSKLHLWPTPQLKAMPYPQPNEQGQGPNPCPHGY